MAPPTDRVAGSLFGLAYGDALGKPTEFLSIEQIIRRYGPDGPADLPTDGPDGTALVTDDTQMALAVAEALTDTLDDGGRLTPGRFEPRVRDRFLTWLRSPENNRAPGITCMNACASLAGKPWLDATVIASKGCGANMRVTPIALPPDLPGSGAPIADDDRAGAAQLQGAMTHGHPTALAASELTMWAVRWALGGVPLEDLPGLLRERAHEQRAIYREEWLGPLWRRDQAASAPDWISQGWDDCLGVLARLDHAVAHPDRAADPCLTTGAGWIAEEALATALHCVLLFPDEPVRALSRAAATSGDSDSIAALAGAVIGAAYGMDAWPADWAGRIEHRADLARLAEGWTPP